MDLNWWFAKQLRVRADPIGCDASLPTSYKWIVTALITLSIVSMHNK
jgi:hypothetical protein